MKKTITFLLALFCLSNVHAQLQSPKLDDWLATHAPDMGGRLMLVVYKDNKLVYSHAVNNMNTKQKMVVKVLARRQGKSVDMSDYTMATRQQIASCSKWLSAALVMTFVDEGKLKLTDTVGKYLPILSKNGKGAITISDCLSHRTGLLSPDLKESLAEMKELNSMDEAISKIASYPVEGPPGKIFRYSNAGLQIAAAVIEKISSKSFNTLFVERIAGPLEMKSTDFGNAKVPLPAGGGISTPGDYMNFLTMILQKGFFKGKRILSESSIAEMQVNRLTGDVRVAYTPAEAGGLGYGYGEWVMDNNIVSSPGLFGSFPWGDNKNHYCAFLMAFYLKPDGRQEKYAELRKLVEELILDK